VAASPTAAAIASAAASHSTSVAASSVASLGLSLAQQAQSSRAAATTMPQIGVRGGVDAPLSSTSSPSSSLLSQLPLLPSMIRRCLAVSSTAALASSADFCNTATSASDYTATFGQSGLPPAQQLQALTSLLDSLFSGTLRLSF
jgi:hypothetical protein